MWTLMQEIEQLKRPFFFRDSLYCDVKNQPYKGKTNSYNIIPLFEMFTLLAAMHIWMHKM